MAAKQGKMANLVNYRMRVTLNDGRQMTGQMLAFDKHMNLVLADTEEFRKIRRKQATKPSAPPAPGSAAATIEGLVEEKRTLGLIILRGTQIVSCSVEGPPPSDPSARLGTSAPGGAPTAMAAGQGISRPAGRGLGFGGPGGGLTGPAPGGFGGGFGGPPPPAGLPQIPRGQPPPGFGQGPPPGFGGRGGPPPGFGGR